MFIFNIIYDNTNYKWGLGIGDWGLGIGDWAQSPIPISIIIYNIKNKHRNFFL